MGGPSVEELAGARAAAEQAPPHPREAAGELLEAESSRESGDDRI